MLGKRQEHPHQVIHVGFACRMDVLQELQKVEGVAIHQMDSYGQIWLVLQNHRRTEIQEYKYSISSRTQSAQMLWWYFFNSQNQFFGVFFIFLCFLLVCHH